MPRALRPNYVSAAGSPRSRFRAVKRICFFLCVYLIQYELSLELVLDHVIISGGGLKPDKFLH